MCECICIAMYLNIKEFINDEREQEKLKKMIKVTEALEGTFSQIRIENKENWMNEGMKEVYNDLLQNITLNQLSEFTGKKQSEILDILNSK